MTKHVSTDLHEATATSVRVVRTIKAPAEKVYDAFLDPAQLSRWFGPADFTVLSADIDPRIGGQYVTRVEGPSGITGRFACEIRDLSPGRRIVLAWSWIADALEAGVPPQAGSLLTITLRPVNDSSAEMTELTLLHEHLGGAPDEDPAGIADRWHEALAKLAGLWADATDAADAIATACPAPVR